MDGPRGLWPRTTFYKTFAHITVSFLSRKSTFLGRTYRPGSLVCTPPACPGGWCTGTCCPVGHPATI